MSTTRSLKTDPGSYLPAIQTVFAERLRLPSVRYTWPLALSLYLGSFKPPGKPGQGDDSISVSQLHIAGKHSSPPSCQCCLFLFVLPSAPTPPSAPSESWAVDPRDPLCTGTLRATSKERSLDSSCREFCLPEFPQHTEPLKHCGAL